MRLRSFCLSVFFSLFFWLVISMIYIQVHWLIFQFRSTVELSYCTFQLLNFHLIFFHSWYIFLDITLMRWVIVIFSFNSLNIVFFNFLNIFQIAALTSFCYIQIWNHLESISIQCFFPLVLVIFSVSLLLNFFVKTWKF